MVLICRMRLRLCHRISIIYDATSSELGSCDVSDLHVDVSLSLVRSSPGFAAYLNAGTLNQIQSLVMLHPQTFIDERIIAEDSLVQFHLACMLGTL